MYKVLIRINGKLKSSNARFNTMLCVEYSETDWTYPKFANSYLFVFTNLEDLEAFLLQEYMEEYEAEVYKCEAEEVESIDYLCFGVYEEIQNFWNKMYSYLKGNCDNIGCYITAPKGTVGAKRLKLKELVYKKPAGICFTDFLKERYKCEQS